MFASVRRIDIRPLQGLMACLLTLAGTGVAPAQIDNALVTQDLQWRLVGPFRGGRTRAITGIPGQPHTYLAGVVNGGVWRSDDDGRTWTPIFDSQPTQSIGAIAVAASNPKIIYVGSGEGLHRPDLSVGNGIYRSNDAGRTWTHLALEDAQQIPSLAVDPHDANRVYAAVLGHPYGPSAQRGVYRSLDGGLTWSKVLDRGANIGSSFVRIDPNDANTLYAGFWHARSGPWEDKTMYNGPQGGLYKSTDGGDHWHQLTEGLPAGLSQITLRPRRVHEDGCMPRRRRVRIPLRKAVPRRAWGSIVPMTAVNTGIRRPAMRVLPCASAVATFRYSRSIRAMRTSCTAHPLS